MAATTLEEMREWPCEGHECKATLGKMDDLFDGEIDFDKPELSDEEKAKVREGGHGYWFCGGCWDEAWTLAKDEVKRLRAALKAASAVTNEAEIVQIIDAALAIERVK